MVRKLGEILIDRQIIVPTQIEKAIEFQRLTGCLIGKAFVSLKMCSYDDLDTALYLQICELK